MAVVQRKGRHGDIKKPSRCPLLPRPPAGIRRRKGMRGWGVGGGRGRRGNGVAGQCRRFHGAAKPLPHPMNCAAHSGRSGARWPGAGLAARPQRPTGRRGPEPAARRAEWGGVPRRIAGASARAGRRGAARPQQCALGAQRGPEPANGGRSGAAYLGQSPGAVARAGRRVQRGGGRGPPRPVEPSAPPAPPPRPDLRREAWRGGGLGTRWRVWVHLYPDGKRPKMRRSSCLRSCEQIPTAPGNSPRMCRGWPGRGGRMPVGASAARGGSWAGWLAGRRSGGGLGGEKCFPDPRG